ncbi:helix-turn-helix transcriptional regulator [Microlunatus soli]|nr:AAA family ATPase [Microlunatus soli]
MPEVPVLVGRTGELDALIDAVLHPPAVALVEGEAGIGKTRLIHEAVRNPAVRDRVILLGSCHPLREPFPYGPVFDLLRQLGDDPAELIDRHPSNARGSALKPARTLNPVCGALRPYLPELAAMLPPAPEPLHDPRASRHRLFRAVRALLEAVGPTVMVVEDLHWSDDGTRDLLRFLVADPPPELSVVLSYRREDLAAPGLPLGSAYRSGPDVTAVLIPLYPLGLHEVRCLCAGIRGGGEVVGEFAAEVHRRTAGIPFVVEEVVRALPEPAAGAEQDPELAALAEMAVPALLQEASAEQMSRLSPAAVAAVRAASVLQTPSEEDVIAAVMQAPSVGAAASARAGAAGADPAAAIGEALDAHVLYEWDDRYGFRHALAQQAVYQSLPGQDRRRLHGQVVDVLQRRDPQPLRHLAHHARMAGRPALWRQYAEAAAAAAREMGDVALAVEVLEELLSDGRLGRDDRARIAVELSRDAVVGLSRTRVSGLLRSIVNDAQLPDGVRGEIRLNLGLLMSNQQGRYSEGRVDTELAVEELRDRPELAARGMAALAMPSWGDHPHHVYQRWIELAEESSDRAADPGVRIAVRANRLSLMMSAGDPDVWHQVDAMIEAAGPGAADGTTRQIARACCNFADTATVTGHYAEARRLREIGRRLAARCGASFFEGLVEGTSLRLDWYAGAWEGLADRARDTLDVVQGISGIAADAHLVLGFLASAAGEWDTAATELDAAGLADPANAPAPILAAAGGAKIRLLLARGAVDAARAEANRGIERIRRKAIWAWSGDLAPMAVRALVNGGQVGPAESFVAELADGIAGRDAPLAAAALHACRGIIAVARGQHTEAVAAFTDARAAYRDLDQPYMAARIEEAIYRCQLPAGDEEVAHGLLMLADRFAELGAVRDAARCRQALRSNRVTPPSRRGRRGYGDELSPREREVARMVATGHTNREIADVLYLSPRTVEQHVARVLRKLNVSSRSEVSLSDNDSLIPSAG